MSEPRIGSLSLAEDILDGIHELVLEAESETKPLELDPYRGRLFELFVAAEGGGCISEDGPLDLTADGLCQQLAKRWGLAEAAQESVRVQGQLTPTELARMRLLWSVMRMWMEWDYAWKRWGEFHRD